MAVNAGQAARPHQGARGGAGRAHPARPPRTSGSCSATPPTCARRSRRSAPAPRSCVAPTCSPCARWPARSRRATPTPAATPSASPPTGCASPRLRDGARRRSGDRVRLPAARRRQGRRARRDPLQARPADGGGAAIMQQHPMTGSEIVRDIEFLGTARDVIRHHHERWDGTGYPDGLAGGRSRCRRGSSRSPTRSTR